MAYADDTVLLVIGDSWKTASKSAFEKRIVIYNSLAINKLVLNIKSQW